MQGEFNAEFAAAKQRKQAELDKIVEASNRMTAISEELAHMGAAVGEGQGGPSWTHMADDADNSVLTVKVGYLVLLSAAFGATFERCMCVFTVCTAVIAARADEGPCHGTS